MVETMCVVRISLYLNSKSSKGGDMGCIKLRGLT